MINQILKEVHKHMRTLEDLKDKGLNIFSFDDAKTLIDRLKVIVDLIVADKVGRKSKVQQLAGKMDEEDLEYF
jgi:hypothetical protein